MSIAVSTTDAATRAARLNAVPTTGRALLAWADAADRRHRGTSIRWLLLMWGSYAGFKGSIVGWDAEQVAAGWKWATKHIGVTTDQEGGRA